MHLYTYVYIYIVCTHNGSSQSHQEDRTVLGRILPHNHTCSHTYTHIHTQPSNLRLVLYVSVHVCLQMPLKENFMGDYVKNANFDPNVPINVSQQRAVESLNFSLEKIQGPPGAVLDSRCSR